MRYVIIRNQKSDKFTLHNAACRVAVKHYEGSTVCLDDENTHATVEVCLADMVVYADECGWERSPKVKICNCAKTAQRLIAECDARETK